MPSTKVIEVLYCCSDSEQDEQMRQKLEKHLSMLKRQGVIANWHQGMISPGKEWEKEIDARLKTADIILLLISSDFTASDYHWNVVVQQAMQRHKARNTRTRVIPVLLRRVDYWKVDFGKIKALPEGEKPVTDWKPYDNAFENIAKGIREVVKELTDPYFHIKKFVRRTIAGMVLVAKAFVSMAVAIVSVTTVTLYSVTRVSRYPRRNRAGITPLVKLVVIVLGVLFLVSQVQNFLGILVSKAQNFLGIYSSETKPNRTLSSTQNLNSTGWIWIGMVNNTSGRLSVGEQLVKPSDTDLFPSIVPPVIPSPKAVVTVKYKVNLRKDKSLLTDPVDELQRGEKLVILKVEPIAKSSQNSRFIKVRAQVSKCNKGCK
ncbi:MAG: toll/interleukin-1 receptor domain-containing protein [Heteroscytonema crispum UTEX LB 1556]